VKHALRGLYFEGSSFDGKSFYVWTFVLPLFVPTKHVSFNLGKRLRALGGADRWNAGCAERVIKAAPAPNRGRRLGNVSCDMADPKHGNRSVPGRAETNLPILIPRRRGKGMFFGRRKFLEGVAGSIGGLTIARTGFAQSTQTPSIPKLTLNVRDFGAAGNGNVKDTGAFQQAIDWCGALGGGEVLLPPGTYLSGAIALRSNTTLGLASSATILGSPDFLDYPVTQVRWEGKWIAGRTGLIYAIDAVNIGVAWPGKIAGNPALGGRPTQENPLRHPALIECIRCKDVRFEDFSTDYRLMWSIHPTNCENVSIRNLTIRSTGGNGDGLDIDSCKHVRIEGCDIATGDDCIAIKSGRGSEAYTLLQACEDILIRNCKLADSIFACIGIGSETSGGIRNVRIENCQFTHAQTFAIYIKTQVGRGVFIEDISASDLDVSGTTGGFLRVNALTSGLQDESPVPG
jgi:polygalacturonase